MLASPARWSWTWAWRKNRRRFSNPRSRSGRGWAGQTHGVRGTKRSINPYPWDGFPAKSLGSHGGTGWRVNVSEIYFLVCSHCRISRSTDAQEVGEENAISLSEKGKKGQELEDRHLTFDRRRYNYDVLVWRKAVALESSLWSLSVTPWSIVGDHNPNRKV